MPITHRTHGSDQRQWLREARQMNLTDPASQRGILMLEQLLAALTPKETALLPNYPNPFNPETWIPYRLATPADVSIAIYAADGGLVRTLDLGHQSMGNYESRRHNTPNPTKNQCFDKNFTHPVFSIPLTIKQNP